MPKGPRSLKSLHELRNNGERRAPQQSKHERSLDALLNSRDSRRDAASQKTAQPKPTPEDDLRDLFHASFIPVVEDLNDRYAERGVSVFMDASDFLSGGRSIAIEITFEHRRHRIEGTVISGAIACTESRFVKGAPGAVTGGPRLRTRDLDEHAFREFLYDRMIQLVKADQPTR
jgi:hypothetical protein